MVAGLALIPLSLLAMSVLINRQFAQVRSMRASVEQTMSLRETIGKLLIANLDIETATRGYVLTSNPRFLEPLNSALERRGPLLNKLRLSAIEDPRIGLLAQDLARYSDFNLKQSKVNIEDVRAGHVERANARIAEGTGKRLMDRIRADVRAIDSMASADLVSITGARQGTSSRLQSTTSMLLTAIALLLAGVAALVARTSRQRQAALRIARQLHERSRAMFDGAVDGMLLLDQNGNIQRLNPSVIRMFGYPDEALIGRHNTFLMDKPYPIDVSSTWLASVGVADERGAGKRQEFIGRRADGTTFDTEVAISRVSGNSEQLYVAAIRDMTAQKRAEAIKSEFVATVSHELRTPLTSIGGSLGLLEAGAAGPLEDKSKRLVTIAHNNCQRLVRLINDILDIEKMESGSIRFDLRRIQLAEVINRTVSANAGFALQHDVQLAAEIPPWPQCVIADPDRLEQLLTNLISNAIKHSPAGGQVDVFAGQKGDRARIEVRDRGSGVPPEFRARIFEKFAMADTSDSRARGGTGLGLSIAREIANQHGGKIGFEDREGGGTTFFAEIPLAEIEPQASERSELDLPLILHVDDDSDCLDVVSSAFIGRAQLVSVTSVDAAERAIAEYAFAAAVIDVGMPPRNGLELIPVLRSKAPAMPVILFTADDRPHDGAQANAVLIKSRATLDQLVEAALGGHQHWRKHAA